MYPAYFWRMDHKMNDLLEENYLVDPIAYRKKLLPLWIKIFAWLFLVCGVVAIPIFILSFFVADINLALYHIETNDPHSLQGIIVNALFLLKGMTAYGLLWAKKWGVQLAITDAVTGIVVCIAVIFLPDSFSGTTGVSFPLELVVLVLYLIKMLKIKDDWQSV